MQWVAKKALDCACVRSARACGLVCTGTASLVSRRTQGMRAGTYRTVLTHGSSCGSLISGLRNHDAWAQALKPKDGWEGNIGGGGNRRAYVEAGCCADNAHVCAAVELLRESPSARQYAHHLLHGRRLVQSAEHTSLLSHRSGDRSFSNSCPEFLKFVSCSCENFVLVHCASSSASRLEPGR
jgi:hypothetical protein